MHRTLKIINEVVLTAFLFAIVGLATITTIGLSPVAKSDTETAANNSSSTAVLGTQISAKLSLSLADSSDSGRLGFKDNHYTYDDVLRSPVKQGRYQKPFIIVENNSTEERKLTFELKLAEQYNSTLAINISDPAGNTYNIKSDQRTLTLAPQTRQVYQLIMDVKSTSNFDIPFEVWVSQN